MRATSKRAMVLGLAAALVVPCAASPASARAADSPEATATTASAVHLLSGGDDGWRADRDLGSLYMVNEGAHVPDVWDRQDAAGRNVTGRGIGVALIDSGVTEVKGLEGVVHGPDLSFESQADNLRNLDTFGHGTHMAGIITGRDPEVRPGDEDDRDHFVGVAPDSTLVSIKVAGADGATDISQVIAAIDWAVQHRNDPGLNIRVLNLSFGSLSEQSYLSDPLAFAVEAAWRNGIVVVVSAGNEGNDSEHLTNPAVDPYVIAVGAADHRGTETRLDDTVATFSSRGSEARKPDLVAPGRSLVSLRVPGSAADQENPTARVTDEQGHTRMFRGSGTSQAAAFVSATVALLLQKRPNLTPDQVKALLKSTADPIPGADDRLQGAGLIDVRGAYEARTPTLATQTWPLATGAGSIELARGGSHVADPETGEELVGEQDIFGQPWDGRSWAAAALSGRSWAGGDWNGATWAGRSWAGRSWAGVIWSGRSWAGRSWAGRSWADNAWDGRSWAGRSWAEAVWSGRSWAGRTWAGRTWAGFRWDR
ncbi:MAG: peptidase and in kexin sedolisin [Acidimicrobiales bacterium]|nr:peptidase and in kexin sedolisin [Acidimicrobiales bacterium]